LPSDYREGLCSEGSAQKPTFPALSRNLVVSLEDLNDSKFEKCARFGNDAEIAPNSEALEKATICD